jgi:hypothetical protein
VRETEREREERRGKEKMAHIKRQETEGKKART